MRRDIGGWIESATKTVTVTANAVVSDTGVWLGFSDEEEFGEDSVTFKALRHLGINWLAANNLKNTKPKYATYCQEIEEMANEVRSISYDLLAQGKSLVVLDAPESFIGTQSLNSVERILWTRYALEGVEILAAGGIAWAENRACYTEGHYEDGENGNAFQHSFWNYLMTELLLYTDAKKWANAHEYGAIYVNTNAANVGTVAFEMDMYNNEYGRRLYTNNPALWELDSLLVVSGLLQDHVSGGALKRVSADGKLIPTNGDGRLL